MKTIQKASSSDRVNTQASPRKKSRRARNVNPELRQNLSQNLQDLGKNLINFDPDFEPKIWEKKDRFGNTYYKVYDPICDRYLRYNSEAEVRRWLDERYYL